MTVIVGIKATDGVAIASDGQASYGIPGGSMTIKQPVRKLSIHGGKIILGCSGPVALSQAFSDELASILEKSVLPNFQGWPLNQEANAFREFVFNRLYVHVAAAAARVQALQPILQNASSDALMGAILSFPLNNTPQLVALSPTCQAEFASGDLPFVSIGSGQAAADPFLAFIRRCMWGKNPLTLAQAKFGALWAVKHTCESQPGLVGAPYQVLTLERQSNHWTARQHTEEELQESLDRIDQIENHIRNFQTERLESGSQWSEIPKP